LTSTPEHPSRHDTSQPSPSDLPAPSSEPASDTPPRTRSRPWRQSRQAGPTNPDPDTPPGDVYFAIGRVVGAHGIRGEVKLEIYSDDPDHLRELRRVYFNDDPTPRRLANVRFHGRQALLTFPDITDRDAAEALRGTIVRISGTQARPLAEGEFFLYQLVGLTVVNEADEELGRLTDIIQAGEVDVYVVRDSNGQEQLFPALKEVVLDIDPGAGRMVVRPQVWEE
jgi:16S rRNA processing protein RimM